ncbi:unnamed protein product [Ranitomeya imitator]|uniref:Uncharacterized protein n=1 Tax=Ranitomeya imitator TaxID=111125 RepID=A0ABN9LXH5_9NEOB|nr:unnamed protein product [Ranitomeya imitator]
MSRGGCGREVPACDVQHRSDTYAELRACGVPAPPPKDDKKKKDAGKSAKKDKDPVNKSGGKAKKKASD